MYMVRIFHKNKNRGCRNSIIRFSPGVTNGDSLQVDDLLSKLRVCNYFRPRTRSDAPDVRTGGGNKEFKRQSSSSLQNQLESKLGTTMGVEF